MLLLAFLRYLLGMHLRGSILITISFVNLILLVILNNVLQIGVRVRHAVHEESLFLVGGLGRGVWRDAPLPL